MDIVAAYESYCNFIDLLDDDSILTLAGMEAATDAANKAESVATAKTTQKKNGLIGAIAALFEGLVKAIVRLLGLEADDAGGSAGSAAMPAEITLENNGKANPEKLLEDSNRILVSLRNTTPGSPEYEKCVEKLARLIEDYEGDLDDAKKQAQALKDTAKAAPRKFIFKTKSAKTLEKNAKILAGQNKYDAAVLAKLQKILNLYKETLTTFNAKDNKKLEKQIKKAENDLTSAQKSADKNRVTAEKKLTKLKS